MDPIHERKACDSAAEISRRVVERWRRVRWGTAGRRLSGALDSVNQLDVRGIDSRCLRSSSPCHHGRPGTQRTP